MGTCKHKMGGQEWNDAGWRQCAVRKAGSLVLWVRQVTHRLGSVAEAEGVLIAVEAIGSVEGFRRGYCIQTAVEPLDE